MKLRDKGHFAPPPTLPGYSQQVSPTALHTLKHAKVDGLDLFYREAGPPDLPTLLLLHGLPTSSHMFRDLIPLLADRFHVVAPDYPGFGYSSRPSPREFNYTFDHLADVWGKGDFVFLAPGAEAYKRDLKVIEVHYLDAGHFALETNAPEIAGYMRTFLAAHWTRT